MPSLDFEVEKQAFRDHYGLNVTLFTDAGTSFRTLTALLLADNDAFPTPTVVARVKDREECIKKFARKYQAKCEESKTPYQIINYITDLIGVRVICLYETDIQPIRAVLLENFQLIEETDKSLFLTSQDDVFGYKGLHLDVKLLPNRQALPEYGRFKELRFEIQIRTTVQDAWSVLDHKIKYKKTIPQLLKRRINRLAALFELADQEFVNIRDETTSLEAKAQEVVDAAVRQEAAEVKVDAVVVPPLDAFSFLSLAKREFSDYPFLGHKVDGFVQDLLEIDPQITAALLHQALTVGRETLTEYKAYQRDRFLNWLNPYTTIRHALYLYDRTKYVSLLFDLQRRNFDEWLEGRQQRKTAQ